MLTMPPPIDSIQAVDAADAKNDIRRRRYIWVRRRRLVSSVCGAREQDGFIRVRLELRQIMLYFNTKSDYH